MAVGIFSLGQTAAEHNLNIWERVVVPVAPHAGYDSVPFPRLIRVFLEPRPWAALLCPGSLVANGVEANGLLVHGDELHRYAGLATLPKPPHAEVVDQEYFRV